jgi:hypothetical protein
VEVKVLKPLVVDYENSESCMTPIGIRVIESDETVS